MRVDISSERLRSEFVQKVGEISGQVLLACYQCGKCSAGCPMVASMDILPNQVVRLAQLGMEEDLREVNTMWVCASCLTCAVRCPRGVDLARVMEALRVLTLRENVDYVDPTRIPRKRLAELPQIALVSSFMKDTA
jgi:heterodisulfide reductase subunit C